MADLLECVIQIKGVADTPRRLGLRLREARERTGGGAEADARCDAVACRMADAELVFQDCLSRMLGEERAPLPPLPDSRAVVAPSRSAAEAQALFAGRRADTVRRLDGLSAAQLNRVGVEPSRGPMIVADFVALMLAHDTESLGDLMALG